jgi:hypothetical protein
VTSPSAAEFECRYVCEDLYCARGEAENRIKEQQRDLFGTRARGHTFRTNSIRVCLSAPAHLLIVDTRRLALEGTDLAGAQAATLRTKILKIGALVSVSVRRVCVRLSSAFPLKEVSTQALERSGASISTA